MTTKREADPVAAKGEADPARSVLVVEDDPAVARAVARLVPSCFSVARVGGVADAKRAMTDLAMAAAVVDIGLPDGSGLSLLGPLRDEDANLPVIVLTAQLDRRLVNQVHRLGAEFVCKPSFESNLRAFFDRLAQEGGPVSYDEERLVAAFDKYGLTPRECEIVRRSLSGVPRGRIAEVLGVSENTVKKQVRSILKKTHQGSLPEAVWVIRTMASRRGSGVRVRRSR